jgi:hypothetical protein
MAEVAIAYVLGKNRGNNTDLSIKPNSVGTTELKAALETLYGKPSPAGTTKVLRPFGMNESDFIQKVQERVKLPRGEYGLSQYKDGQYILRMNGMDTGAVINLYEPAIGKNLIERTAAKRTIPAENQSPVIQQPTSQRSMIDPSVTTGFGD